jgi:Flp pilus assembly protein TadD
MGNSRMLCLIVTMCGCSCFAQDPWRSPGEIQAAAVTEMRGRESTAPSPEWSVPYTESGVTSVARLRHKIPKQAIKANQRATNLAKSDNHQAAASELEHAIAYDPEYATAHNNLGVQYVLLRRPEDAQREFLRAIQLDPALDEAFLNLGWLELQQGDLTAAEQHGRRATTLSARNDQAKLLLQAVLAQIQHRIQH